MGSGGPRGLQTRWLPQKAAEGSIPSPSVFIMTELKLVPPREC